MSLSLCVYVALHAQNPQAKELTANLKAGGKESQNAGGSSVPNTSAVPAINCKRRGASHPTSTRSSLSLCSLNFLEVDPPPPPPPPAPTVPPPPPVAVLDAIALSALNPKKWSSFKTQR